MDAREEIAMLRNECGNWRIAHARVESRLMNAETLLSEAADFVSDIRVGLSTKKRDGMVKKLRDFIAPNIKLSAGERREEEL